MHLFSVNELWFFCCAVGFLLNEGSKGGVCFMAFVAVLINVAALIVGGAIR
jgi:hypothetical protein